MLVNIIFLSIFAIGASLSLEKYRNTNEPITRVSSMGAFLVFVSGILCVQGKVIMEGF